MYDKAGSASRSASISLRVSATDNYTYMTAPTRGYNAGSTYSNDVATIGTLDAYTPMVRTTGNQDIGGIKNHLNNIRIGTINGRLAIIDTRNYPDLANANIIGGKNIGCGNGQGGTDTISEEYVRISGFGVTGGVEHMFITTCPPINKSVILRVKMDPSTNKAQLMFGSNVISEVDL